MNKALALTDSGLDRYMSEVNRHPLLTREAELTLAKHYLATGEVSAAHQLVVSNLRFVVKIAHEYRGYGFKLLDLVQEGNVGLMVAVKKFDPDKGYRLISYAVWWIRAYIQSFILRSWSMVRMGTSRLQRKLFFKLRSEKSKGEADAARDGKELTTEALAARLEVGEADVLNMEMRLSARDFSLDAQLGDDTSMTHLDMVSDEEQNQEESLGQHEEQTILREKVQETLGGLNDKERYIVENRLLTDEPKTLQEIGDAFKISRERIRQLETRVIGKLRTALSGTRAAA